MEGLPVGLHVHRIRDDKHLRKAVKVIEKRFLCEMYRGDPYTTIDLVV
jgi:hypothetical protein